MGTIFGFVSKDLKAKMDLLKELLVNSGENFSSVKEMIEYEKENELLNKKGYTSGSRTLLRLHRGLGKCLPYLTIFFWLFRFKLKTLFLYLCFPIVDISGNSLIYFRFY